MSEVKDTELALIYPPEQSMSGRNSVYQFCDERQQQVSYAVCLHTLKKIEDGRMGKEEFVECQRAYTHNNCPAKKMRTQEIEAGQALFFIERPRHLCEPVVSKKISDGAGAVSSGKYDMNNPSYARGWAIGGREGYNTDAPVKPTRNVGPIKKSGFVEETMADALTALVADEKAAKAAPEKAVEKPKQAVKKSEPAPTAPVNSSRPQPGESMADFIKRRALEGKKK